MIAVSLAQIGEVSFVLAGMGVTLGRLTTKTYNLILAGALISLNPSRVQTGRDARGRRQQRKTGNRVALGAISRNKIRVLIAFMPPVGGCE